MTAVEWFATEIKGGKLITNQKFKELLEQAKEMEKTNIKDAFEMGQINAYENHNMDSDDYYLLNFKSE